MKATIFAPTLWTEMTDDMSETVNGGSHCYEKKKEENKSSDYCCQKKEKKSETSSSYTKKYYDYKQFFVAIFAFKSC